MWNNSGFTEISNVFVVFLIGAETHLHSISFKSLWAQKVSLLIQSLANQNPPYLLPWVKWISLLSISYKMELMQNITFFWFCFFFFFCCSLALHPWKNIVVTGSDDHLWKMWALPDGNITMTGEGHADQLSGCCFYPRLVQTVLWTSTNPFWGVRVCFFFVRRPALMTFYSQCNPALSAEFPNVGRCSSGFRFVDLRLIAFSICTS